MWTSARTTTMAALSPLPLVLGCRSYRQRPSCRGGVVARAIIADRRRRQAAASATKATPRRRSSTSAGTDADAKPASDEDDSEFVVPSDFVPSPNFDIRRLEAYTEKNYDEGIVVKAILGGDTPEDGMPDEVIVYRGFSAYLTRPTDMNAEVDVLPSEFTTVVEVDRIKPPYKLDEKQNEYIERGMKWDDFDQFLKDNGF